MSTRVTNKMMSNNAKYHINQNKAYLDKLSVQEASEKKINNPSDDPVIAIRSLRFRSSLADINQYLSRNLSDAKSWTDSTFTALDTARDLMTKLKQETISASSNNNSVSACKTYLDAMKSYVDEYYYVGNSTNEDRYLFTGYRTSDSLTMSEENLNLRGTQVADGDPAYDYVIREGFMSDDIQSYTFLTKTIASTDVTRAASGAESTDDTDVENETDIVQVSCYRIRLSYDNLKSEGATAEVSNWLKPKNLELCGSGGYSTATLTVKEIADDSEIGASLDDDTVYYNTTTGMLIFSSTVREQMLAASDNAEALNRNGTTYTDTVHTTGVNFSGIRFTYEKDDWEVGDLKPEHYFDCVDTALSSDLIYSNYEQTMNYSVGANQQIQVNTNANEAFNPQVRRFIDELSDAIDAAESAETMVSKIEAEMEGVEEGTEAYTQLDYLLAAAKKQYDCAKSKMNSLFENGITEVDGYYNETNLAATECGTTQNRISIINSRLTENKTTVNTQASENENIDIADVAVDISEADIVYQAALLVTGKINQQSLLNYI